MAVRVKQWRQALIGSIIMVLIGGGIFFFLRTLAKWLATVEPTVLAPLVAGAATIIVSVVSVIAARHFENRATILKENREKKMPIYEYLMAFMFRVLYGSKLGQELAEKEMQEFFASFTQKFMVWGSDDVVKRYVAFRRHSVHGGDPAQLMFLYEDLIRAIRRDLGHANKGLGRGDILSLFVNDVESLLPDSAKGNV